jgi:hypothetical protein
MFQHIFECEFTVSKWKENIRKLSTLRYGLDVFCVVQWPLYNTLAYHCSNTRSFVGFSAGKMSRVLDRRESYKIGHLYVNWFEVVQNRSPAADFEALMKKFLSMIWLGDQEIT